jgi:hypothetical protein
MAIDHDNELTKGYISRNIFNRVLYVSYSRYYMSRAYGMAF